MAAKIEDRAADDLDSLPRLPARNRLSLALLLLLTGLNAFNDNILKMMLVGLAPKVVEGSLGRDIGLWLGAIILTPYVLLAPVAGWLSDRFSKRRVILAMLVTQSVILVLTGWFFAAAWGMASVIAALVMFFLLAVQSTLFSPAKMGILKELAGSRRIGMVSGGLQMATMLGILSGLSLGGPWYDRLLEKTGNPWSAAAGPVKILFAVSMVALVLGFLMQKTVSHPGIRFQRRVFWSHFRDLADTLGDTGQRRACLGAAMYWFVASMMGAMFVGIGLELYPDTKEGGAATASSVMTLMVGLGTVAGSALVAGVCRKGVQLGVVPLGALGMALTMFGAGSQAAGTSVFYSMLILLGVSGACYLVPVMAYLQDRAAPEKRGRVLASMNLLDSVAGVIAVVFLGVLQSGLGVGSGGQFWVLAVLMLGAGIYVTRLLPQALIRFLGRALVRLIYRVRTRHEGRLPREGGVLMVPNHASYMDAFLLSTAFDRPVRFVIWDAIYKVRWFTGWLRLFGTVPVSPERAKDAIKAVAKALEEGEVVCIFPEGQLTRHGMVNELRRGYELMARQADAPVLPVYLDGLWGSVFSFERGRCFTKLPKRLRYPVTVSAGEPLPARAGGADAVRSAWMRLAVEAFAERPALARAGESSFVLATTLRLLDVEWLEFGEKLWVPDSSDRALVAQMRSYAERSGRRLTIGADGGGEFAVAVGRLAALNALEADEAKRAIAILDCPDQREIEQAVMLAERLRRVVDPAWVDPGTGAWIALSCPDPVMPAGQEGNQHGRRPGAMGRLLPCLEWISSGDAGSEIRGLAPGDRGLNGVVKCPPGWHLSADGFVAPV
jgi:acyl-[acyl-carrier-protein]-phospholipid O-acyltransferase/long-chain-fatty-acid--[acyl-carrier-protein] ligase